jgi:hypothetical protein
MLSVPPASSSGRNVDTWWSADTVSMMNLIDVAAAAICFLSDDNTNRSAPISSAFVRFDGECEITVTFSLFTVQTLQVHRADIASSESPQIANGQRFETRCNVSSPLVERLMRRVGGYRWWRSIGSILDKFKDKDTTTLYQLAGVTVVREFV